MNRRRWRPFVRPLRPTDISTIQRPWGLAAHRWALRWCEEQARPADRLATPGVWFRVWWARALGAPDFCSSGGGGYPGPPGRSLICNSHNQYYGT